ncbi:hypothetical protein SAMN05892883_2081 [Jatrophihabitans sp. GAS493]|uniref:hypothetical protein n=1 Tax=Jatrophihabitans sp. GAS493 TaxID=1907575 RepID=UPI000BC03B32|nr:hypothetical protein [Jatrophihabitans sp. GAS493]SOD72733.1 hypothetical protein SAMN05892883_2081 [Jatrophihabitans sp. GAS493]
MIRLAVLCVAAFFAVAAALLWLLYAAVIGVALVVRFGYGAFLASANRRRSQVMHQ